MREQNIVQRRGERKGKGRSGGDDRAQGGKKNENSPEPRRQVISLAGCLEPEWVQGQCSLFWKCYKKSWPGEKRPAWKPVTSVDRGNKWSCGLSELRRTMGGTAFW